MNATQLHNGYHTMEIHERVAITVVSRGRTFRKVVNVITDGSYDQVNSVIQSYVKSAWKGIEINLFSWSYVA